jgi:hypothetical protein
MKMGQGIRELPTAGLLWLVELVAMATAVRTGLQLGVAVAGFWAVWSWLGRSRPALRDARRAELAAGTRLIDGRVRHAVPMTLRAPHRVGTEIVL